MNDGNQLSGAPEQGSGDGPRARTRPRLSDLHVGDVLFTRVAALTRASLIDYAAASGDHNPIHWSERFAREVGLEGVIAHGMLTLGLAGSAVTDWAGDPGALVSLEARFSRPVPVPDPGTTEVEISGTVGELGDGRVRVDLKVSVESRTVLARSQAVVALSD